MIKYDPTITLGNGLTIGSMLVAVLGAFFTLSGRVDSLQQTALDQRREFTAALIDMREASREQRQDIKDLSRSMTNVMADTALIRGRMAADSSNTGVRK